ncbi:hypothetical protein EU528_09585 [Candidatus Thorarchaeota archaeon]|nr:MAG: hypothetical protein EU528_09585 [Candidatus Thorarchaeota archaeon]
MLNEPPRSGRGRNNNLLGGAIVCFMIGLPIMQILVFFIPLMALMPIVDPTFIVVLLVMGIIPTICGFYLMYKWYYSGY